MTTITKSIVSATAKKVDLIIEINNGKVCGIAKWNEQQWTITNYAVVQGRKVLSVKGGPAPYLLIDNNLYAEIESIAKAQYRANMSAEAKAWETVTKLEAAYKKLVDRSDSSAAIINAQAAYEQAINEFVAQYPNSDYIKSNRVHYNNNPIDINSEKIWTN
jgi:uncharacterized protein YuzE